jgi:hypothetical protein
MSKEKRKTIYRDSKTGRIISKKYAENRNPATWEKERVRIGTKKTKKKK